jgi:multisubunit Na+/H+ antiporter MnhE subunit
MFILHKHIKQKMQIKLKIALYKASKTLHPGGITYDHLAQRRMRCHWAMPPSLAWADKIGQMSVGPLTYHRGGGST